ncbi:MAG TPA: hypothetical protein VMT32_09620 [Bryobacteraceae bacterium]|nr:hypothetical protein [Bryobacteraceae bacterium]
MTNLQPLVLLLSLIALVGTLRKRRWVAASGVIGLFVIISPAAEWLFSRPLEGQYPVRPFKAPVSLAARTGSIVAGGKGPAVRLRDDLGQSAQKRIA